MALTDEMLSQEALAVAGVSRHGRGWGFEVWKHLRGKGIRAYAINPKAADILGEPAYACIADLPEPVGGIITVTPPASTVQIVRDCIEAGVTRIWMQPGSECDEAVELAEANGIQVSTGACMLLV